MSIAAHVAQPVDQNTLNHLVARSGVDPDVKEQPRLAAPIEPSTNIPRIDEGAESASPWLDGCIEHLSMWSPRSYHGYYEMVAVWLLSVVAARRVYVPLGRPQFTPLFLAMVGRSTFHAKSTVGDTAIQVLQDADLGWMLSGDSATPQRFIQERTLRVPENYDDLTGDALRRARLEMMFAGQRGWRRDEFGGLLHAMARSSSVMADYSGLLRQFDDCAPEYSHGTVGRGTDRIVAPYLPLLTSMTPADLRDMMRRGHPAWSDGWWARFAFSAPPSDERRLDRFPPGERKSPPALVTKLRNWHEQLGVPTLAVNDDRASVGALPVQVCQLGSGVEDAFYVYGDAMIGVCETSGLEDLDSWHGRAAVKALRIATLLGSLENDGVIELRHWARGQQIVERWRESLYRLYEQVNTQTVSEERADEDAVRRQIERLGSPTLREIGQHIRGKSNDQIQVYLNSLVRAGEIEAVKTGRTVRYQMVVEQPTEEGV